MLFRNIRRIKNVVDATSGEATDAMVVLQAVLVDVSEFIEQVETRGIVATARICGVPISLNVKLGR